MPSKTELPPIPAALADVALIEDTVCAATMGASVSHWRDLVLRGIAPAPAIRSGRFTRWRIADVRQFLIDYVANADESAGEASLAKSAKALAAAQAKRAAAAQPSA